MSPWVEHTDPLHNFVPRQLFAPAGGSHFSNHETTRKKALTAIPNMLICVEQACIHKLFTCLLSVMR